MINFNQNALRGILGLLVLFPIRSGAQSLFIDPPRQHINSRPYSNVETLTLNLMVDSGIASSVAWGTTITLTDTQTLRFVPDFGGAGKPFRSLQPFFDIDLSDPYTANSGTLPLFFSNFMPGATLGNDGFVTLGQFQVQVLREPNYPSNFPFGGRIELAALEAPPFGSGVLDELGNNLIVNASGAAITSRPPTPEPSALLTMVSGVGVGLLFLRHRCRKLTA